MLQIRALRETGRRPEIAAVVLLASEPPKPRCDWERPERALAWGLAPEVLVGPDERAVALDFRPLHGVELIIESRVSGRRTLEFVDELLKIEPRRMVGELDGEIFVFDGKVLQWLT